MKKNVGSADKVIRIIIAIVAAYFAWRGGFEAAWISTVLWIVAVVMLLTALLGTCGIYSIFGVNTCKRKE